ncbi:rab-like protein 2A isoform X1 [Sylvia atricapilla]|uniref:rab-like protein 2A isoform X1 n=1 Tax=Sylvia atricapilla TaxID=48155 RepID=UPI0033954521
MGTGGGAAAGPAGSRRHVLSPQAPGAVPARWLVSLAARERGSGAGTAGGGVGPARWERGLRLSVGSLTRRSRPQQVSTFALTLYQHRARVGEQEVRVDFWDTAGQERFRSMHASYYHQAHACIMVFDVQRKVTYKNLNSWYKELREFRPEIPCIVVANKIDADMKVTQKSFNFARKFSLPFYFVSAADGTNVVKLFNDAIRLAVAYKQHSGDFMDEVLRELESFDLQKTSEDLSDIGKSCTEEEPSSA